MIVSLANVSSCQPRIRTERMRSNSPPPSPRGPAGIGWDDVDVDVVCMNVIAVCLLVVAVIIFVVEYRPTRGRSLIPLGMALFVAGILLAAVWPAHLVVIR